MANEVDAMNAPGRVEIVVMCGEGFDYSITIDPEDGAICIKTVDGDDADGLLSTPKSWAALREAVDSAVRIWELSKGGHE